MTEEPIVVHNDEVPTWENLDDMKDYFTSNINYAMVTLTRIMWEAGHAGIALRDESKYGDNAIQEFADAIHKGKTWVYECIKMAEAYQWSEIQDKFLKAGIPASSIARLSSISNEGARAYVEDKLISNEITYEEIAKAKKEYEEIVENPEAEGTAAFEIAEQSVAESNTIEELGPEDKSVVAANAIRRDCSKTAGACEKAKEFLEEVYNNFRNELDMISDESLLELSEERFCDMVEVAMSLEGYISNLKDSAHKIRPDRFPEE